MKNKPLFRYIVVVKHPDGKFMAQALKLALLGGRAVAPNPMVGTVIVKDGKIIGEGYHRLFGGPHAEVNAIRSVSDPDKLKGATMYVTLEPCRHYGKTPPCLDLIEEVGIERVVCGSHDPFRQNPKLQNTKYKLVKTQNSQIAQTFQTNHKSHKLHKLSKQNTNLTDCTNAHKQTAQITKHEIVFMKGQIADQCKQLNKFFYTWVTKKRPYITVKIAMSADGFVAGAKSRPVRMTTAAQDREVHKMRADHQAILVGINTVLSDDPQLTVRYVKGRDPLRVVPDSRLRIPQNARILKDGNHLIAVSKSAQRAARNKQMNIWVSLTKKRVSLKKLFRHLADIGISSVLAEPGPTLYRSLKRQKLIDELIVYRGRKKLGSGLRLFI